MSDERPVLRIVVPGDPVPKGRPRLGRGGKVFTPERTREYERHGALCAMGAVSKCRGWRADWSSYSMTLAVYRAPSARFDLDNLIKAVGDFLNSVAWLDDSAVREIHATMSDDPVRPRVEVEIRMLGDEARVPPKKRPARVKAKAPRLVAPSLAAALKMAKRASRPRRRR